MSNYTSRQVKLNYPNKVLSVTVNSIAGTEYWDHANGSGDIWYSGSASKKYYRWEVTFSVTDQQHGSHLTRDDFRYTGLDIAVNDWIGGATTGQCLKIISISSKTRTSVTCVVEDWLRYNTFKSTTGNGIFGTGAAVVFTLNENGIPMLDPLPTSVSSSFFTEVLSRFNYLNPQLNYVLQKTAHGFSKGDVIAVTSSGYAKANAATSDRMVGIVTETGPGPNQFMILPNQRIIDFDPSIPGIQGDYIYVDSSGNLSNTDTGSGKVAFLNVRSAIPTVLTGDQADPTLGNGNVIAFNGEEITFTGNGGSANISEIVTQINAHTSNHNVIASTDAQGTTITSDSSGTIYGLVGGYTPFSAYFNTGSGNTLVNFLLMARNMQL